MRSVLAGLRRLIIPWGARDTDPHIAIGADMPDDLVQFMDGRSITAVSAILYRRDANSYVYHLLGVEQFNDTAVMVIGIVDHNSIVPFPPPVFDVGYAFGALSMELSNNQGPLRLQSSSTIVMDAPHVASGDGACETEYAQNTTTSENVNFSGWGSFGPQVNFRVPKSGKGYFRITILADADNPGERFDADVKIFENLSPSTVIHNPTVLDGSGIRKYWNPDLPSSETLLGFRDLQSISGLSLGTTYGAQLQLDTHGTNVDVFARTLAFVPLLG